MKHPVEPPSGPRQSSPSALVWLVSLGVWCAACGGVARPPVMAQLAEVRSSPAAADAQSSAPQAHAHALRLEERAEKALADGDGDTAALLAEQALAAHEQAWVLARLARAERRRLSTEAELEHQRQVAAELRAQQQRLAAEAAALELRAQVVREALPLPPHGAAEPERLEARRKAAAALATQARLLCVGARLLGQGARVAAPLARLDELEGRLAGAAEPGLLQVATELRAECLRAISEVRRGNVAPAARAPRGDSRARQPEAVLPADALLDELSAAGVAPSRDDRGVGVVLREVFGSDGQVTAAAQAKLQRLTDIAASFPDFPLLLVGHSGSARDRVVLEPQLGALGAELGRLGARPLETQWVGDRQPLLPLSSPGARERNQRFELVFVAPGF